MAASGDVGSEVAKAIRDIEQVRLLMRGQPELGTVLTLAAERLRHLLPQPGVTDAEVAREFFRRFGPTQVHMGAWRGRAAVAELEDDGTWISEALPDGARREEHSAGEDGFTAALERARQLVRGGR